MSQSGNGQTRREQLPYYQEYVEQILRPRALRLLEEVQGRLPEHAWQDLLVHMAREQGDDQPDPQALAQLRELLETALGLKIEVDVNITIGEGHPKATRKPPAEDRPERHNVEVVDRSFPDNPLARAVGSVRRADR
jgi:hypothetical protein